MYKEDLYKKFAWGSWAEKIKNSSHKTIFLHGIMGGELYDVNDDNTRWVDLGVMWDIDNLEFSNLSPNGALDLDGQAIISRSTVSPPIIGDYYADYFASVGCGVFCYDWRDSIPVEAKRLADFLRECRDPNGHNLQKISFVTHSMGGCVLLTMLAGTTEFDDMIENLVFCAPPFHGAMKPIRVIEDGVGTPIDFLISDSALKRSAATMPGLFQLLPAHKEFWEINPVNGVTLKYPIVGETSLFYPNALTNRERFELRQPILDFTWKYYTNLQDNMPKVVRRLGGKINVIVGLNGKTECMAQKADGVWRLHTTKDDDIPGGKVANGDGTVLFQSSILPGLPTEQYWAFIPNNRVDTHGGLVNQPAVSQGIINLLTGNKPNQLANYAAFSSKIFFGDEVIGADDPEPTKGLKYIERDRVRQITPLAQWGEDLNPGGGDDRIYYLTRQAAYQVLAGGSLAQAASRIGQTPEFLKEHIRHLLLPLL